MSMTWTTAAAWLAHSAAGGTLLLLLAWGLARRTRQPVRRQRLAEWGVCAALVVAVLSWAPAWLVLDWAASAPAAAAPKPTPSAVELPPPEPAPFVPGEVVAEAPDLEWEVAAEPPVAPMPAPPPAATPAPLLDPALLTAAMPWLVAAYTLFAAWFGTRWLLGHWALARLLRTAEPAPEHVARLFTAMTPGTRRPRLLVSRRLRVPVSCGLWRPTVVLPAAMCGCPDAQRLRWVFAHELTHLERLDAWSALLFGLAQPLFFFVPWFWWLRRQVRLCQEYIADAAAVQPRQAADYAEFLLSLVAAPPVPRAATGVSGQSSDLYRRVTMLLQEPLRMEKRCPRRWSLGAAGGLLALAVVLAGVGLRTDAVQAAAPEDDIIIIIKKAPDAAKPAVEPVKVRAVLVPDQVKKAEDIVILHNFVPGHGDRAVLEKAGPGARVIYRRVGPGADIVIKQLGIPPIIYEKNFDLKLGVKPVVVGDKRIVMLWKQADASQDELRKRAGAARKAGRQGRHEGGPQTPPQGPGET